VREALFSAVESALGSLTGLAFLDLYAGSGAVGLEAASRGADPVTLVEQDRRTAGLIRANAAAVDLRGVEVVAGAVSRHLAGAPGAAVTAYDVVFLDPPYDLAPAAVTRDLRALTGGWLASDALVVVERSARTAPVDWPDGYEPVRSRTYGETALWFATWRGSSATAVG
jgi:16S rRNA (guanine966-N2)-methyltransferase